MEAGPLGVGRWPVGGLAPKPAMIEPSGRGFAPRPAAHHEEADRRLAVDAVVEPVDPAVEPATAQGEEIFGEIAVSRSRANQAAMSCAASVARAAGSRASASALRQAQVACFRSKAPPWRMPLR